MNPLFLAAQEVFGVLQEFKVPACLIGGMALQRWGEPRLTLDIDLTLITDLKTQEQIVDSLLTRFKPRISDAKNFALTRRVLLLQASNGIGIDLALGITSFEAETVERSSLYEFAPGFVFPTCSAEDLVVHKCFAGRGRDLADVETVIARNLGRRLDLRYIRHWLRELEQAAENPEISARFETLLQKAGPDAPR
jgi:nucleotidyltransferase AbiEii toxin of type IV toxin-antitoxin system